MTTDETQLRIESTDNQLLTFIRSFSLPIILCNEDEARLIKTACWNWKQSASSVHRRDQTNGNNEFGQQSASQPERFSILLSNIAPSRASQIVKPFSTKLPSRHEASPCAGLVQQFLVSLASFKMQYALLFPCLIAINIRICKIHILKSNI